DPALSDPATIPELVSIVNTGTTTTVTIKSPPGVLKPGDCANSADPACSDANSGRVTVSGALVQSVPGQPSPLNATYLFSNVNPSTDGTIATTTFTIPTANVPPGTYKYSCAAGEVVATPPCIGEPQLVISYL